MQALRSMLRIVITAGLIVLLLGDPAWAWGPATHVGLGETVLGQLALLPAAIAALLRRHAASFLYGNIAADVVFAKRLSRVKQFCHHWTTGFRLLDRAENDASRAFAYGYLSHLAADTVAHGKYVPRQIIVSGVSVNFGHLYWELRADNAQPDERWRRLDAVLHDDHAAQHDQLRTEIRDTLLSYAMNRAIFDGMNKVTVRPEFRWTITTWGRLSRHPLPNDVLSSYEGEAVDRILSVLTQGNRSQVLREDPNGTSALMQLSVMRRESRQRERAGESPLRRVAEASRTWAPSPRPSLLKHPTRSSADETKELLLVQDGYS